jgi:hypothetical protein
MPRSSNSEESDQQILLSQESVELGFGEKMPRYMASPSRFRQFISSCNTKRLVVSVIIVVTVGILTFTALTPRSKYSPNIFTNHCGSTAEEAIDLGCKFDVLNYSWQPPECFDEEIYNRYWEKSQEHGPLKWYADSNFTKELPQNLELLMHTPYVWSEHRFHVVHCMYTWELMHHALTLNKPVVEFVSLFNHTMHCGDTVLDEDWKVQNTSIKASHNRCVMLT